MSKTIPAPLLAHKALSSTTLTDLLLIGPLPDTTYRAMTLLDIDVAYDSGGGLRTYKARTGMEMSALSATNDLGVDNAEATTLYPIATFEIEGFTQTQIDAGVLDKVPFVVYRVNYKDLTAGRHEIMHSGTIGEVRTKHGQVTVLELRSLSQQLKQSIVEVDSINCRAKFGSQPIGTGGGVVEERRPCGFDITAEWVNGTVTSVSGSEPDREFTDTGLAQAANYFAPGLVEWLTGDNAGQENEIDSFGSSIVGLQFPTTNAISVGDTFRIRRDCPKTVAGCQTFWSTDWVLHYRGEPWIPIGDSGALNTPGAAIAGNISGTGETV